MACCNIEEPLSTLWGITDGSAGMQSQVVGVLEALRSPYQLKTCRRRAPWKWLPIFCWRGALSQLDPTSDRLEPPWPTAVITSGRRSAALGLTIKAASSGTTKAIHLTDPRACRDRFDLIVAMEHDAITGSNVLTTSLALHRLTPELLHSAANRWQPHFSHLPKPWISVLIGGSTHHYRLTESAMRQVIAMIKGVLRRETGSILITPSRRTGMHNIAMLRAAFADEPRTWMYDLQSENPYLGLLACADYIVVTEDSVNMLSEAAFTGKPLYILPLPNHEATKPARFAASLVARGIARTLSEAPLTHWQYDLPDERARIAAAIRTLL